jgi:hypothetical protein
MDNDRTPSPATPAGARPRQAAVPTTPVKAGSTGAPGPQLAAGAAADASAPGAPKIKWDDANLRSSYANVCNVSWTREEIVLVFGMNQAWQSGQKELTVQLNERLILSPFAARRLSDLLANVVREYESRFGSLADPSGPRRP